MTAVFLGLLFLSLLLAAWSRRGHRVQEAKDFFVASGQFGTVLFFFLAVGETYSILTMLGFPAGIYAKGTGFVSWFVGYILLAFPVGYVLQPWIWRAGRRYGAVTLPDLFRRHYDSRALELVVTVGSILFLLPYGTMQFVGLDAVLVSVGWGLPGWLMAGCGALLAFAYIAISGIRAPAYVAVLKDTLMVVAILLVGLAAIMPHQIATATSVSPRALAPSWHDDVYAMSTILLQCVGFSLVPQTCAFVFAARSAATVRRAQVFMPLYMLMFPALVAVAWYALGHDLHPATPNALFLDVARRLLPGWAVGIVLAAAALSALVVTTGMCLAIGPLVARNLVPGLDERAQTRWSKAVVALYLALSVASATGSHALMAGFNNLFYFGITQTLPGLLAILRARRTPPAAIIAGLVAGDLLSVGLSLAGVPLGGLNPGLIGLGVNGLIVLGATRFAPGRERLPVSA